MRFFRPSVFFRFLYPGAFFRIEEKNKVLYLTFDDGPDPVSTPVAIDILERQNVKGMFFCSGKAAEKYPLLVEKLKSEGHLIGNHGYNHYKGCSTSFRSYCMDVEYASVFTSGRFFRPPYGKITPGQYRFLSRQYHIFFWDIMPYDFDRDYDSKECLNVLKRMIRPGSVIVLHDKPESSFPEFLDDFIVYAKGQDYNFDRPFTESNTGSADFHHS